MLNKKRLLQSKQKAGLLAVLHVFINCYGRNGELLSLNRIICKICFFLLILSNLSTITFLTFPYTLENLSWKKTMRGWWFLLITTLNKYSVLLPLHFCVYCHLHLICLKIWKYLKYLRDKQKNKNSQKEQLFYTTVTYT